MTSYAEVNQARRAHVKLYGSEATNRIIAKYAPVAAGETPALSRVAESDWDALLKDFTGGGVSSRSAARPSSVDQLDHKGIWAKFNSAGSRRSTPI